MITREEILEKFQRLTPENKIKLKEELAELEREQQLEELLNRLVEDSDNERN